MSLAQTGHQRIAAVGGWPANRRTRISGEMAEMNLPGSAQAKWAWQAGRLLGREQNRERHGGEEDARWYAACPKNPGYSDCAALTAKRSTDSEVREPSACVGVGGRPPGQYRSRPESIPRSTCEKRYIYARGKDRRRAQRRLGVWHDHQLASHGHCGRLAWMLKG